ncbi:MAG: RluA family pseudouridine synthase [Deltaproteobacteria bacterium]|nr:RluA family pseudouridine synthase [Deltaproteobacteria bacterium]
MQSHINDSSSSPVSGNCFSIKIDSRVAGIRLDRFLSQFLQSVSRSRISSSVSDGLIKVEGEVQKNSYRLKGWETITGSIPVQPELNVVPEKVDFHVLFEDEFLLILSKPPGIVVHPGSGNYSGTLVNGLVYHCRSIEGVGGDRVRPGIVHRLDKDTSGIMVAAKTESVHGELAALFKNRQVQKWYIALVHGIMKKKSGRLVAPIGRHPVNRKKMAVLPEKGRHAATGWEVLGELKGKYSLLRLGIETGRTHQIRVHMAHLGHPVAGDQVYGGNRNNSTFSRQLLHAHRLVLQHPVTADILDHLAPLWQDFSIVLRELGWKGQGGIG